MILRFAECVADIVDPDSKSGRAHEILKHR